MFNTYVDAGGNFIDTADLYTNGTSETWLGIPVLIALSITERRE
ncbi:aldo/keto reductase [Calothrix rhizosoleniae]|nr:aldo/keto reductase [Calothrix rhizosoleniae]